MACLDVAAKERLAALCQLEKIPVLWDEPMKNHTSFKIGGPAAALCAPKDRQQLRELGNGGEIIYLTTSSDYAIDSYSVRAFFYLLKPIQKERLFEVLDAAVEKLNHRRQKAIVVTTRDGPRRLLLDQILYVERVGRCLRYYCAGGNVNSMSLRVTFRTAVEPLLSDPRFFQCGSSFAFNLQHVAGVKGQEVLLDNGCAVAVPRASVPALKHAWGNFWLEESRQAGGFQKGVRR